MLRFHILQDGKPAKSFPLDGAYLAGSDNVPIKAEFELRKGELLCHKRVQGPAALCLPWPVKDVGRILLETTRLLERDRPYNLHLELARGQMMRLCHKREDWGLFDVDNVEPMLRKCQTAQDLFVEALKTSDIATAAKLADEVLSIAVPLGEQMALFHASVFLNRRRQSGQFSRQLFGCYVNPQIKSELYRRRLLNGFDFATLPIPWKTLEPKEGEYDWESLDEWVEWLHQHIL